MPPGMLWFFALVIGLPMLIGIGFDFSKRWFALKEKQLDQAAQLAADKALAQSAHIERLESRVRVLERIATDRGVDLADRIDALRDDNLN